MSSVSAWSALASGVAGGVVEGAGVAGRQHVDDVGAERDRLGDGGVVGDTAVDQVAPAMRTDGNTAGMAALARTASTASPSESRPPRRCALGGDDVDGDQGVLEPLERQVVLE